VRCFLVTYRPLVRGGRGRDTISEYGLPAFIDGSCRREPDFESRFPSITSTCRGRNFAPRLCKGDRVAYLSVKGRYPGDKETGWRFVAVLRVLERFETHELAAKWYRRRGCALPSNCLVKNNPPKQFHLTNRRPPSKIAKRLKSCGDSATIIRLWDATYRIRVRKWPVLLACKSEFRQLVHPPQVSAHDMNAIFGRIPSTLNPPRIRCTQLERLIRLAARRVAAFKTAARRR
jgi:hypothetical protein